MIFSLQFRCLRAFASCSQHPQPAPVVPPASPAPPLSHGDISEGFSSAWEKAAFSSPISLLLCFIKSHLTSGPFASCPCLSHRLRNSPCSALMHFEATYLCVTAGLKKFPGWSECLLRDEGAAPWVLCELEVSQHLKWWES